MDWINMNDRDKLFNYAKEYQVNDFCILSSPDNVDSYYNNCENAEALIGSEIAEYGIEQFGEFRKSISDMWEKKGFRDTELLATIVSTTAHKNMPMTQDGNTSKGKTVNKKSYEKVSEGDGPPVFVYEF